MDSHRKFTLRLIMKDKSWSLNKNAYRKHINQVKERTTKKKTKKKQNQKDESKQEGY